MLAVWLLIDNSLIHHLGLDFLDLDSLEVARQLTLIEEEMWAAILPWYSLSLPLFYVSLPSRLSNVRLSYSVNCLS